MPETPNPTPEPKASFWKRRIVDPIVHQMTQGITPEKIALTLAVGSAFALFPILGTTTLLCLVAGICLRLNQPIIQIINGICTPLHLPAILMLIRLGEFLFGITHTHLSIRYMNQMFWDDPSGFFERFGITALHAIVAWAAVLPLWLPLVYFISLPVLRELNRIRAANAAKTDGAEPPVRPVP